MAVRLFLLCAAFAPVHSRAWAQAVVVGSKPFGESYLLGEMFAQALEARGIPVERRLGLGATEIAFAAIRGGAIDVYPEYTGIDGAEGETFHAASAESTAGCIAGLWNGVVAGTVTTMNSSASNRART